VASTIRLPFDRDIIHRVVQNFSIDDQPWIKNPLGLYASRLACEVYVISAGANHIQNVHKCLNGAGYDVKEVVFTGMAEGESLLDDADRSGGAAILDIGNSVTEFTLFSEGALSEMHVMPLGSRDLAGDFKERAEFQNLISVVKDKTAGFVSRGGRMNAVILGGGFAFVDGTVEVLEERLGFPVKMGVVKGALGNIPAIGGARSAVAMGLARYGRRNYEKRVLERGFLAKRLSAKVVDIFNNYF
jgi:cell division ATPase FtsA